MLPDVVCPPGGTRMFCSWRRGVIVYPRVGPAAAGAGAWAVLLDRKSWRCRPLAWRPRWACRCHNAVQDGTLAIPQQDGGVQHDNLPESRLFPPTSQIAVLLDEKGQECEGGHEETLATTASGAESQTVVGASEENLEGVMDSRGPGNDEDSDPSTEEQAQVAAIAESLLGGQMEDKEFMEMPEITLGKVVKHIGDHSERMKSAEEVVKRAIRLGRESDLVLSKFFKSCGMQGRLEVMQSCFAHWLKEGNVTYGQKSISALITSSLRNNHPQCGKEIVRKLIDHGVPVGTIAFNSLIQEFSRAEMIEEALELFDWLQCSEEQHADKRTYQTVLWGMKRCKKLDALQMVYEAFLEEGWELDATLYFAFMTAAATAHDASFAEDMLLLFKKGKGELDCKVLNMYLQVLSQSACFPPNLEEVLEMYSASGKEPDAYTFTALLTGAYRSYQRMSVIDMLVKEISKSGMAITPVTSCAAILGYKNCTMDPPMERCERAQKVFDLTEDKNRACYHLLMSLYAENMDLATAIRLQSDMEAVGLPSNSRTYKTLEQACTEAGLMGYAEKYEKLWKQALKQDETESSAKLGKE